MTRTSPDVDARNLLFFRGKSDGKWMTAPLEGAEGSMELVVYRNQEEKGLRGGQSEFRSRRWNRLLIWRPMHEPFFFFIQEANDFSGESPTAFRIFFDGRLPTEFHPFLVDLRFAFVLPENQFFVAGPAQRSTRRAARFIFCNLDFRGGAASVFLTRKQEDPHYKERCTLALFFLSRNGQQLRLLVQRGVLSLL
jgi:hypothetical protein